MKAIILVGKQDHGKTSIIRRVINNLLNRKNDFELIRASNKNVYYDGVTKTPKKGNVPDCYAVFRYKGKNILIVSFGDATRYVVDRYNSVKDIPGGIDLLICASHENFLDKIISGCGINDFSNAIINDDYKYTEKPNDDKIKNASDKIVSLIDLPFENYRFNL